MRILHVNKYAYRRGGAESYMLDVVDLQREQGHTVEVWAMRDDRNDPMPLVETFAPNMELDPPPSTVTGQLQAAVRMVHNRPAAAGLAAALERFQPDVAHLHNVYHQLSPSILRPLGDAGVPAAMTLHDYKLACPTYHLVADGELCTACVTGSTFNAVRRRCNRGSLAASALVSIESGIHRRLDSWGPIDALVCPSRYMRDVMAQSGIDPDRLHHIPNFSRPPDDGSPEPPETVPTRVVFAGRLSGEKGIEAVLAVAAALPAAEIVIAGDGPARPMVEQAAADQANVRFVGRLDRPAVLDLLGSAAVVMVPSTWPENQPMVILEAYAMGTPVIASRMGGLPELVEPGVTGQVVEAGDHDGFVAAVRRYLDDPASAVAHGAAGSIIVERDHGLPGHLASLDALYTGLVQAGGRA